MTFRRSDLLGTVSRLVGQCAKFGAELCTQVVDTHDYVAALVLEQRMHACEAYIGVAADLMALKCCSNPPCMPQLKGIKQFRIAPTQND